MRVSRFVAAAAVLAVGLPAAAWLPAARGQQPEGEVTLSGDVLHAIRSLSPQGVTDPNQHLTLGVSIRQKDPAGETEFIRDVYNPASPLYHHFLTPPEFNARFGSDPQDGATTLAWLRKGGLHVTTIPDTDDYVLADGTVAAVESLLHVSFANYTYGLTHFYANTTPPRVPAGVAVTGIVGLNSFEGPHLATNRNPQTIQPAAPKIPQTLAPGAQTGDSSPQVLWSVYDQPVNNFGDQQKLAIFGWGDTNNTAQSLKSFEAHFNLPQVPLTITYYGPAAETITQDPVGEEEWAIDTQSSSGMAPNVSGTTMYMAKQGNDADLIAAYNAWVGDIHGAQQGSSSFSGCEETPVTDSFTGGPGSPTGLVTAGNPNQDGYEAALRQAVAEGRTMFASAGDTGAGCPATPEELNGVTLVQTPMLGYPAVSQYAVAVGGTVMYYNPASGSTAPSRALEYGWTFGGGGNSYFIPAPPWQARTQSFTPCLTDPHGTPYSGATFCRTMPDVAAQSGDVTGNGMTIYVGSGPISGGGTSLSSPLWLGMWARVQAAQSDPAGNGFAAPALYGNSGDFFDVGGASADTIVTCNGATPLNCTRPGFDWVTGLGTPDVTKLATDIAGSSAAAAPCTATNGQLPPGCPSLGGSGSGSPVPPSHPGTTTYYLHQDGCGATNPASNFLSTDEAGHGDTGDGCGVIGGLPLDEVFYQLGSPTSTSFATLAADPSLPLMVDGTRPVTGTIATQSWTGGAGGVGTVTADVDVTGVDSQGNPIDLGTTQASITATPTSTTYAIPFSIPADAAADGAVLTQVSISVTLHGLNENASASAYKGASFLNVPTHIPN